MSCVAKSAQRLNLKVKSYNLKNLKFADIHRSDVCINVRSIKFNLHALSQDRVLSYVNQRKNTQQQAEKLFLEKFLFEGP